MPIPKPKYLDQTPSDRGRLAEKRFIKTHVASGATPWSKDDFSSSKVRIELKHLDRDTKTHVLNFVKIMNFVKRAEANGQVPFYVIEIEGGRTFCLTPDSYLKGLTL